MVKRRTVDLDKVATHSNIIIAHLSGLRPPAGQNSAVRPELYIDIQLFQQALAKLEHATVQDCLVLHHQANTLASAYMRQARQGSYTSYRNWLAESLVKGAKRAHQWTNEANQLLPIRIQYGEGQEAIADPEQAMSKRLGRWTPMWCKNVGEMRKVRIFLSKVEQQYRIEQAKVPPRRYEVAEIKALMKKSPMWKQGGADSISIAFCRNMPDEAIEGLIEIYHKMDQYAAPPIQILSSIMALIPKPDLGERPIGILSYI